MLGGNCIFALALSGTFIFTIACGGATAGRTGASDPVDDVAEGTVEVLSTKGSDAAGERTHIVVFRDWKNVEHLLLLRYEIHPVRVLSVMLDGRVVPRGPSWGRIGRRLDTVGVVNDATYILRCLGRSPDAVC